MHLVLDIIITAVLFIKLWRQRKMGTKQTKWIISKALLCVINISFVLISKLWRASNMSADSQYDGRDATTSHPVQHRIHDGCHPRPQNHVAGTLRVTMSPVDPSAAAALALLLLERWMRSHV